MSKPAARAQRGRPTSWYQKLLTRRRRQLSISLVACLATLLSLVAQPVGEVASASAQFHAAGSQASGNPGCNDPPGSCNVNPDNGCPTAGPMQAPVGQHCVPIPGQLVIEPMTVGPAGATRCAGNFYAQVQLLPTLSDYEAVWWSDFGLGTRWWSAPGTTYPGTVLGIGYRYPVPKGYAAWSAAYGNCTAPPETYGVSAWGVTDRWAVRGQITYAYTNKPAAGISVTADCPSGYTTSTNDDGDYEFLLQRGPCTIVPTPPDGLTIDPEKQALDVEGNIDNVDFQVYATLYFAVKPGLSVKSNSSTGAGLIKAGTAFTEQVTLQDISKNKTVVVAPIYPTLSGNANGGALQPVGGVVQKQITSLSTANPSPIVVLRPGERQVFDSVVYTDASRMLGTDNGGKKVSGGTRAYIQFSVPNAFTLGAGDDLKPLDPRQIVVEKGSTDQITVSIDDSAPDQMPFNGYLAAEDISIGLFKGLYHFTVGLVEGVITTIKVLGSAVVNIPTAVINYVNAEAQLWQEVKEDPVESALFLNIVTNQMLLVYKQAPFLLKQLGDIKGAVDGAVYEHFNKIEQDWRQGDWEAAVEAWADDGTNLSANLLVLNPSLMAGVMGDATIARVPGIVEDLDAAQAAEFAKNDEVVTEALGAGESEGEITESVRAMDDLEPGEPLDPTDQAQIFGVSPTEYASMAETAKKYDVLITLRSRAAEAISLIDKGLSYVKPAAVKLKTVSAIDIKYLGYPADITLDGQEVSTVGQVLIKKPLFVSEDCLLACASSKFEADLISLGLDKDNPVFWEVQHRYLQRYEEWFSKQNGYVGALDNAAKDHFLTLDWHWQENHIYPDMVQSPQKVGFRLAPGPAGTSIPQARVNGGWKSITGDIDLVSITNADGSPLSDERYVQILEELGAGPVQTQHPATATWYDDVNDDTFIFDAQDANFSDKAKYMNAEKCCSMQVAPDGKARAVKFQLEGSQFEDKNDYYINYVGGYEAPAPGVPAAP